MELTHEKIVEAERRGREIQRRNEEWLQEARRSCPMHTARLAAQHRRTQERNRFVADDSLIFANESQTECWGIGPFVSFPQRA